MPPRYLRRRSPERLKPCAEFTVEACDIVPADQCCGAIPCKLCLEWETYADGISYGSAEFATSSWTGTVGGHAFVSYWDRNAYDECEYIVTLDGEEVYRATCYEGASCRNPAGEVAVSTAYLEGTLRWSKHEPRELQLIDDPDTGCRDFFCGTCRCSCECLCVTITEYSGDVFTGEICDTAYDCDPPVWVGTVGYFDLSIVLGRDEYGECIVTATVDGIEQDSVAAPGCGSMAATITLPDYTVIELRCKECTCDDSLNCPCCPGWPLLASGNIDWTTSVAVTNDCELAPSTVELSSDFGCIGTADATGTLLRTASTELWVRVYCLDEVWHVQYRSAVSGVGFEPPASATWADATAVEFVCPDCANAVDGVATGTIDFIAVMACEVSGPTIVEYDIICHGEVTIACP